MINLQIENNWTKEPVSKDIFGNFIESGFGRQVSGMWSEMIFNQYLALSRLAGTMH